MTPDTWMVCVSNSSFTPPANRGISNMLTGNPRDARSAAIACAPCPPPSTATGSCMGSYLLGKIVCGERGEKVAGALLGGPVQHVGRRALLDDAAAVEEDHR